MLRHLKRGPEKGRGVHGTVLLEEVSGACAGNLHATIMRQRALEQELVDANGELESFASVASHDMKEPLRMINSFMELLERRYDERLDAKGKEYIHFARDGARRMVHLIDDLLDYSRIGRKYTKFEEVNLEEVIEEVERLYRPDFEVLSGRLDHDALPTVRAMRTGSGRSIEHGSRQTSCEPVGD